MIDVDFETIIENVDSCDNNLEAPWAAETNKDKSCGLLICIKFAHDK